MVYENRLPLLHLLISSAMQQYPKVGVCYHVSSDSMAVAADVCNQAIGQTRKWLCV